VSEPERKCACVRERDGGVCEREGSAPRRTVGGRVRFLPTVAFFIIDLWGGQVETKKDEKEVSDAKARFLERKRAREAAAKGLK